MSQKTMGFYLLLWLSMNACMPWVDVEEYPFETKVFYVSTEGNDEQGIGTLDKPFQTIGKAIEEAQAVQQEVIAKSSRDPWVMIYIASGVYEEDIVLPPYIGLIGSRNTDTWQNFDEEAQSTPEAFTVIHGYVTAFSDDADSRALLSHVILQPQGHPPSLRNLGPDSLELGTLAVQNMEVDLEMVGIFLSHASTRMGISASKNSRLYLKDVMIALNHEANLEDGIEYIIGMSFDHSKSQGSSIQIQWLENGQRINSNTIVGVDVHDSQIQWDSLEMAFPPEAYYVAGMQVHDQSLVFLDQASLFEDKKQAPNETEPPSEPTEPFLNQKLPSEIDFLSIDIQNSTVSIENSVIYTLPLRLPNEEQMGFKSDTGLFVSDGADLFISNSQIETTFSNLSMGIKAEGYKRLEIRDSSINQRLLCVSEQCIGLFIGKAEAKEDIWSQRSAIQPQEDLSCCDPHIFGAIIVGNSIYGGRSAFENVAVWVEPFEHVFGFSENSLLMPVPQEEQKSMPPLGVTACFERNKMVSGILTSEFPPMQESAYYVTVRMDSFDRVLLENNLVFSGYWPSDNAISFNRSALEMSNYNQAIISNNLFIGTLSLGLPDPNNYENPAPSMDDNSLFDLNYFNNIIFDGFGEVISNNNDGISSDSNHYCGNLSIDKDKGIIIINTDENCHGINLNEKDDCMMCYTPLVDFEEKVRPFHELCLPLNNLNSSGESDPFFFIGPFQNESYEWKYATDEFLQSPQPNQSK